MRQTQPVPRKASCDPPISPTTLLDAVSAARSDALRAMGSFKLKLVVWFALLALLPLGVVVYGYDALATRSEARRVDASLESALRGVVAGYATRLDGASAQAAQLARDPRLQKALRGRDTATLTALARRVPFAEI